VSAARSLGGPGIARRDSIPELVGLLWLTLARSRMSPGVGISRFRRGVLGGYRLPWSRPAAGG